jgi:hypothetical protein
MRDDVRNLVGVVDVGSKAAWDKKKVGGDQYGDSR